MSNSVNSDRVNQLLLNAGLGAFDLRRDLHVSARQRGESMNSKPGRAISKDFEIDLSLAGKRALGSFAALLETARDVDILFSSLDLLTAKDRYPSDQIQLLNLVHDLVDPAAGLSFHAAVCNDAPPERSVAPAIDPRCTCVIDPTLSKIYVSTDLGFRDLFQVSQTAVATGLVLRASKAGIPVDPGRAVSSITAQLGNENTDLTEFDDIETSWLSTSKGRQSVHVVAHNDAT